MTAAATQDARPDSRLEAGIQFVINTHLHFDHAGGNTVWKDEGGGMRDESENSDSSLVPQPASLKDSLETELKALVSRDMGKPLAPSKIHFVSALPKTRNAKVMRRVLRAAYLGEDPGDLSALENPRSVDEIRSIAG